MKTLPIVDLLVLVWMTVSAQLPDEYSFLRNPLHQNIIIVVGTLTIFLVGLLLTRLRNKTPIPAADQPAILKK